MSVALVLLLETWLWDRLQPIFIVLVARLPLETIKKQIASWVEQLSPAFSLVVFAVPLGLLLPFKIAALWLLARGYWISAVLQAAPPAFVKLGSSAWLQTIKYSRHLLPVQSGPFVLPDVTIVEPEFPARQNVDIRVVRSTGQCNTACSLSAGVWKPKVFRGR
jgi:hypothetical protein